MPKRYIIVCDDTGNILFWDGDSDGGLDEISKEDKMVIMSPFAVIQEILRLEIKEELTSLKCRNGELLVFQRFDNILYVILSDTESSEHFLSSQLQVLHHLFSMKFGDTVFYNLRHSKDTQLKSFSSTIASLYSTQQSYLVQSIERIEVNQDIRGRCLRALETSMKALPKGHGAAHALMFVDTKLLAHYAKPKAFELQASDIFLITLYIKSTFGKVIWDDDTTSYDNISLSQSRIFAAQSTAAARDVGSPYHHHHHQQQQQQQSLSSRGEHRRSKSVSSVDGVEDMDNFVLAREEITDDDRLAASSLNSSQDAKAPDAHSASKPASLQKLGSAAARDADNGTAPETPSDADALASLIVASTAVLDSAKNTHFDSANATVLFAETNADNSASEPSRASAHASLSTQSSSSSASFQLYGSAPSTPHLISELTEPAIQTHSSARGIPAQSPSTPPHRSQSSGGAASAFTDQADFEPDEVFSTPQVDSPLRQKLAFEAQKSARHASRASPLMPQQPVGAGDNATSPGDSREVGSHAESPLPSEPEEPSLATDTDALDSSPGATEQAADPSQGDKSPENLQDTSASATTEPANEGNEENKATALDADDAETALPTTTTTTTTTETPLQAAPSSVSSSASASEPAPEIPSPKSTYRFEFVYFRTPNLTKYLMYCAEVAHSTLLVVINKIAYDPRDPRQKISDKELELMVQMKDTVRAELDDFIEFLMVKGRQNMTMLSFLNFFPGLVHFIYADRSRDQVVAPAITSLRAVHENSGLPFPNQSEDETCALLKKKIWDMVAHARERHSQGYTSSIVKQDHFTYSYFLWFEDNDGNHLIVNQPLPKLPFMFSGAYYKELVRTLFRTLRPGSVHCYELFTLHLSNVPFKHLISQQRRLIRKLRENRNFRFSG